MKFKNVILTFLLIISIINCIVIVSLSVYLCLFNFCSVDTISLSYIFIVWGFIPFTLYLIWTSRGDNKSPTNKVFRTRQIISILVIMFFIIILEYILFRFIGISLMEFLASIFGFIIPIALIILVFVISSHKKYQNS